MKLIAWIYRPTVEDEAAARKWAASDSKYVVPSFGDLKFSSPDAVALSDPRYYIPGWKRAAWLDEK